MIRKIGYYTIVLLLFGIGIFRLVMSLSAGKQNIWYLVCLMLLFGFILYSLANAPLTTKGKKFLKKLQGSIKNSKPIENSAFSSSYSDAIFLAAVMGGAYISSEYLYAQELYPRSYGSNAHLTYGSSTNCSSSSSCSSGGDSGGSSCSSSCSSSSCSSGCGGGGD